VRAVFHFLKPAVLLSSSRSVDKSCRSVLIYTLGTLQAGGCVCWEWAQRLPRGSNPFRANRLPQMHL